MKKKSLRIALEVGMLIIIIVMFVLINEQIIDNKANSFFPRKDGNYYAYHIEKAFIDGDDLVIRGWFFELKKVRNIEQEVEDTEKKKKLGLLLYDLSSSVQKDLDGHDKQREGISLEVVPEKRNDIDEYFACEYDYSDCGFTARIRKTKINLNNGNYQIVVKTDALGEYGIPIEAYLVNGVLEYIKPDQKMVVDVEGTDLEKIVREGTCLACNSEYHICIYQHEWKLYWIVDTNFTFEEDGDTFLEYMIDTTQFSKLPSNRTVNGWYWDNIGNHFEKNEITSAFNCGKYRVSCINIPEEYSVTRISVGYNVNNKWIWSQYFRPDYSEGLKHR